MFWFLFYLCGYGGISIIIIYPSEYTSITPSNGAVDIDLCVPPFYPAIPGLIVCIAHTAACGLDQETAVLVPDRLMKTELNMTGGEATTGLVGIRVATTCSASPPTFTIIASNPGD
ncbi:hypothetical protein WG66_010139 [Moniliophthora roreri]|nr:hypothetical protein WG66_010139 [Moniliophthora roreri]